MEIPGGIQDSTTDQDTGYVFESQPSTEFMNTEELRLYKGPIEKEIKEENVNLLPPALRPVVQRMIKQVKVWKKRDPQGKSLVHLKALEQNLAEFLELQEHRNRKNFDKKCRELLITVYQEIMKANATARELKDETFARSVDSY